MPLRRSFKTNPLLIIKGPIAAPTMRTAADAMEFDVAREFPSPEQMQSADVLVFFQTGSWGTKRAEAMDAYFQRGSGAVYLHWAVNGDDHVTDYSKRIGLASLGGRIASTATMDLSTG